MGLDQVCPKTESNWHLHNFLFHFILKQGEVVHCTAGLSTRASIVHKLIHNRTKLLTTGGRTTDDNDLPLKSISGLWSTVVFRWPHTCSTILYITDQDKCNWYGVYKEASWACVDHSLLDDVYQLLVAWLEITDMLMRSLYCLYHNHHVMYATH